MPRSKKLRFHNPLLRCTERYGWSGDLASLEHAILALQESELLSLDDCADTKPISLLVRAEDKLLEMPVPRALIELLSDM